MMEWLIAIIVLFVFTASVVVVAALMNSSRISQDRERSIKEFTPREE